MLSAEDLRELCPADCPILQGLADKRAETIRHLVLEQDNMSKPQRDEIWQKADWEDADARELARTCLKHTFGFGYPQHCTSFPDK
ncbi:MAG TPA: hypothetical protein VFG56_02785 [Candidatus Saccharimonadales bacterium]|nr:hypothetical protein [Candidatus Saccharimonadales bacterium]